MPRKKAAPKLKVDVPMEEPQVAEVKAKVETPAGPVTVVVKPKFGRLVEPFQKIVIEEGIETPVRETNWVLDQLRAGLLIKC
jgi:hypothetical protein